jgi:hypothetical protein
MSKIINTLIMCLNLEYIFHSSVPTLSVCFVYSIFSKFLVNFTIILVNFLLFYSPGVRQHGAHSVADQTAARGTSHISPPKPAKVKILKGV